MPGHNYFAGGQWNAACDQCGRVFKSSQLGLRWDGLMVCYEECMETRNPQDFVRAVPDDQSTPWARPWLPDLAGAILLEDNSYLLLEGAGPPLVNRLMLETDSIP